MSFTELLACKFDTLTTDPHITKGSSLNLKTENVILNEKRSIILRDFAE